MWGFIMSNRRNFIQKMIGLLGVSFVATKVDANPISKKDIIKNWEDPSYKNSITDNQWNKLPSNPAGEIRNGQFKGSIELASGNNCSGNNCSGNNCSGNNCSGNMCSGNNCSGDNCSGNNCSGNNCSGNNCSGNNCSSGYYC